MYLILLSLTVSIARGRFFASLPTQRRLKPAATGAAEVVRLPLDGRQNSHEFCYRTFENSPMEIELGQMSARFRFPFKSMARTRLDSAKFRWYRG